MRESFSERGGGWVVAQFALMSAVLAGGVMSRGALGGEWLLAPGAVLLVAGAVFGVAGARVLGKSRTPFPKPRRDARLVRHGIYARVRHPLYTSVMLLSLGWALCWQSAVALGVALAQVPFFIAKARREERWLRERFPEYADYARRVPAFLPRWRRGTEDAE
ncbi:MAG: isoprenylcysteine carboxylmethyltransferase family protein [Verrucomicrobiales bacterium]|nr:isoprenylcysteine carboxylmethyltransferase family protein [Verrucomicrobiales bacterium]